MKSCLNSRSPAQETLEAFMLMCAEKKDLTSIDNETVINKDAETSTLFTLH